MLHDRRDALRLGIAAAVGSSFVTPRDGWAQGSSPRTVQTPALNIAFEESGSAQGFPVILLHGFPDDARAWDGVVPALVQAGHRAIVPYLRGFGPTRFR